jgi:hypothetical protein
MTKVELKDQVGRNELSYVDGIAVASKKKAPYISDLMETFTNMRKAKFKLNPANCVFKVTRGKILGCLVSTKGIEASPNKIKAILQMQPPQNKKEVQILTGCKAALKRFIAKLPKKKPPLFQHIKALCKSRMGAQATEGLRRSEVVPLAPANTIKSRTGPVPHIVRLCHTLSSQRSSGH